MNIKKYAAITAAAAAVMAVTAVSAAADSITVIDVPGTFELTNTRNDGAKLNTDGTGVLTDGFKAMNGGTTVPESYLTYTAEKTGTLSITFRCDKIKTATNKDPQYGRLYWADNSGVGADSDHTLTKQHLTGNTPTLKGGYAETKGQDIAATLTVGIEAGKKYNFFGYLYNTTNVTFTISSMSFTSSETAPTAKWISRETFGGDQYEGSATALKFSVTPGSNAIDSIKVSKDDKSAEKTGLSLQGETSYEYGIVVNDIVNYNDLSIEINDTNVDVDVEAAEEVSE